MRIMVPGFGPVPVVRRFPQRWRGLRGSPEGSSLALPVSSVHGFGMDRELVVVGLDADLRVVASTRLRPNRILWLRGARWIVELPADATPPPVGTRLTADG